MSSPIFLPDKKVSGGSIGLVRQKKLYQTTVGIFSSRGYIAHGFTNSYIAFVPDE
jgi:hypothetical protein